MCCQSNVLSTQGQKKPRRDLELDSKVSSKKDILQKRKKIEEYVADETLIKVGSESAWVWVVIEPQSRQILTLFFAKNLKKETCLLQRDREVSFRHSPGFMVSIRCLQMDGDTWYPMTCRFLKLKHHLHSSIEKSLIERTMQYINKDRTIESFDDYFPYRKENCKLKDVLN
ncbi:MAG: hypothetical protein L0H53_13075 [Candidatus Nitrosocosmicus sp.]|nr:hypothetical protein [Candidatus Nitrosocosmicus sp.]MDN5868410.1 hypothetical protein [Candidatus Nitrosocosmicus sp.]